MTSGARNTSKRGGDGPLRRGDTVEVRSAAEIHATLDADGCLHSMPFMPEMVPYCGQRFQVAARAEKVCDTLRLQSRRLVDTVLLDDLRCDGSGHGGCQAECRLYWNEAWLRRVDPESPPATTAAAGRDEALLGLIQGATRQPDGARYRCQVTETFIASEPVSTMDPRPYLRELTCGNVSVSKFLRVMAHAVVMQPMHKLGILRMPPVKGDSPTSPQTQPLDLQPGEWVRVKVRKDLEATLTDKGSNRGLWFDREMLAYSGRTLQVRRRVTRIIDDQTGEMIQLKSDCIALEHGVCSGVRSTGRFFCPREMYSYYREAWLERVEGDEG